MGGSKTLGFSFTSYWDLERGKKLPKSNKLEPLMNALRLVDHYDMSREFISAYFVSLSGSDRLIRYLVVPADLGDGLSPAELAEDVTRQALTQVSVNLTTEQWKVRTRDLVTNITLCYLINTAGWVTVRELSTATKFKPAAIKKALKVLSAGKLAELSGEKARSLFEKKNILPMPVTPETFPAAAAQLAHWKTWLEDSRIVLKRRLTVRMTKANLRRYKHQLAHVVNLAALYNDEDADRNESVIYYIDGSIYHVLPRD